jgi:predicted nucleic acid-binding protein
MKKIVIVDTVITIDFLRGQKNAITFFKSKSESIAFSAITVAEIYSGARTRNEEIEIERLFSIFPVIPVSTDIARLAGKWANQYRLSHNVEIPDTLIAATCQLSDAELFTLNIKHYPMFKALKPPYRKNS